MTSPRDGARHEPVDLQGRRSEQGKGGVLVAICNLQGLFNL